MRLMFAAMSVQGPDHPLVRRFTARQAAMLAMLDQRLADHTYLAGEAFTAADVMIAFSLTTMRVFQPFDIRPHPHILAYLKRLSDRPAYRRALEKGDPGMTPLIDRAASSNWPAVVRPHPAGCERALPQRRAGRSLQTVWARRSRRVALAGRPARCASSASDSS